MPTALRYDTTVLRRRLLAPGTVELEMTRPEGFAFAAGQRIRLQRGETARDYSLASSPADASIRLCIRIVSGGALSPHLGTAEKGDRFAFTGPHGYFVFHPSDRHPVFVATGTGIAPFVSMCRSRVAGFTLLHGIRRPEQRYYTSLFQAAALRYVACTASPKSGRREWFHGRVTDFLAGKLPDGEYDFYLCGRREMVRDATLIIDERFGGGRVYTEIFY